MIFQLLQYSVISLVFIAIVHYLISHLTDNLTTPQVRDIVASTNEQYEAIIKRLESSKKERSDGTPDSMKDDLKQYLKGLGNSGREQNSSSVSTGVGPSSSSRADSGVIASGDRLSDDLLTYDSAFGDYDGGAYSTY